MSRFHPRRFLDLAEGLLTRHDEASLRSAVSRAYYGVFLEARDLLGMTHLGSQVHGEAQQMLKRRGLLQLAHRLDSLRKLRNVADYQVATRMGHPQALTGMQAARLIARELDSPAAQRLLKAPAAPSSPARSRRVPRETARR